MSINALIADALARDGRIDAAAFDLFAPTGSRSAERGRDPSRPPEPAPPDPRSLRAGRREPDEADAAELAGGPEAEKPVFQINAYPQVIDLAEFRNPRTPTNPGGDQRPLFAFRDLADAAPVPGNDYQTQGGSIEGLYRSIVEGASVVDGAEFVGSQFGTARQTLASSAYPPLDGIPGPAAKWSPVYASPPDWFDTTIPGRFRAATVPLGGPARASAFASAAGEARLDWRAGGRSIALQAPSRLRVIEIDCLAVSLRRPWLDPSLFKAKGWYLAGQRPGFCSSGRLAPNRGILPLITTGLLLARTAAVAADWHGDDAAIARQAAGDPAISLGPFVLGSGAAPAETLQIVGWFSSVVPRSPRTAP